MTTAEMLAEYNSLTGKNTSKFASRAKGEEQLLAARIAQQPTQPVEEPKMEKQEQKATDPTRSAATAATWTNKEIATSRAVRTNVSVGEYGIYRSVASAFKKLGLPMSKHIDFRAQLKKDGEATFEHEGESFVFNVVKQEELAV